MCCISTKWFGDISQYIADYSDTFLPNSAFSRIASVVPLWSVAAAIGLRVTSAAVLRMVVLSPINEALLTEVGRQSNSTQKSRLHRCQLYDQEADIVLENIIRPVSFGTGCSVNL